MIALTNTVRQLEIDCDVSANISVVVAFTDVRADGAKNVGTQLSTTNGTSDVVICSPPTSGMIRIIDTITVQNSNASTITVRIYYDESGTEYNIVKVALATGDTLMYEDG